MRGTQGPVQGSFGIPPEIAKAAERKRAEAEERKKMSQEGEAQAAPTPTPVEEAKAQSEQVDVSGEDPQKILEKLGAKFTDDDFQKLLFKGFYETELEIVKGKFKATFRTLTGNEYDELDEILADEIKTIDMTTEGFNARRAMLVISYGITHLMGKPVSKVVVNKDKTVDTKATARERRKVLGALSPAISNLLIQKHGALTVALNLLVADPEKYLKNS